MQMILYRCGIYLMKDFFTCRILRFMDNIALEGATNTYKDGVMTSSIEISSPSSDKQVECRATVAGTTLQTKTTLSVLGK